MDLLKAIGRTLIILLIIFSVCIGVLVIATPIIALIVCGISYLADKLNIAEITYIDCFVMVLIPLTVYLVYGNYKEIKQEKKRRDE